MEKNLQFFATVAKGVENVLADELLKIGAREIKATRAGAHFYGDLETGYRACLWLRTANRVLLPILKFRAENPDELYRGVQGIHWLDHLEPDGSLAVDFNTSRSKINHSHYGALKVKDAIVDQFRENFGLRPSVNLEKPDVRVNVYLFKNEAIVSLDLSGESLHKRGYRKETVAAPLKENLAAVILIKAGWPEVVKQGGGLLDPMCGSGTLPIEAALIALDIAPGCFRDYFGFFKWKQHQPDIWSRLLHEAKERQQKNSELTLPIIGYDVDPNAIKASLINLEHAGLRGFVHFEKRSLAECVPPARMQQIPGLVILNPPYGDRIGNVKELKTVYRIMGKRLKNHFQGWRASLFTGNAELGNEINLRARSTYSLYNGALNCQLMNFIIKPQYSEAIEGRKMHAHANHKVSAEAEMFVNRLQKNLKRLHNWLKKEQISCFRAYDRDLPEYAVAIDVYEKWVQVQEYKAPDQIDAQKAKTRLNDILTLLPEVLKIPVGNIFLKVRQRQKGNLQYEKDSSTSEFHEIRENNYKFLVDFRSYLDTGLFLDHRSVRNLIGELARGKHFLNLFSYTGTVTVYAAKGGAKSTTSVDMSSKYLNWAKKNMSLNGENQARHLYQKAECLSWMKQQHKKFGLIFLNPPTFSNVKKKEFNFEIQKDQAALIKDAIRLLDKDGIIIFSNNFKKFRLDSNALRNFQVENLSKIMLPKDFARSPKMLNCWKISNTPT